MNLERLRQLRTAWLYWKNAAETGGREGLGFAAAFCADMAQRAHAKCRNELRRQAEAKNAEGCP